MERYAGSVVLMSGETGPYAENHGHYIETLDMINFEKHNLTEINSQQNDNDSLVFADE